MYSNQEYITKGINYHGFIYRPGVICLIFDSSVKFSHYDGMYDPVLQLR